MDVRRIPGGCIVWGWLPAILTVFCGCAQQEAAVGRDGWISLFNGRDLTGWTPKIAGYPLGDNFADTFRVEEGVLKVCYDKYDKFDGRFGHIFYKTPFSHYRATAG